MAAAIAAKNQGVLSDGELLELPHPALALLPEMPQEVIAKRLPGDYDPIAVFIFSQESAIPTMDDYIPNHSGPELISLWHSFSPLSTRCPLILARDYAIVRLHFLRLPSIDALRSENN